MNVYPWNYCKQIEDAHVQIHDPELRKILNPTTADLRFADYLVKHVTENRDDVFLDGTGWEGGDEWIRAQFSAYLHALLAAVLQPGRTGSLETELRVGKISIRSAVLNVKPIIGSLSA